MFLAPLLPYCHRHQPPPKQQFTILRGNCWAVLTESDTKRWKRCVDLIYLVGKWEEEEKSAHCCVKAICSSRFLADDSSVYVNGDTHTASNVKALDLWQRYQISFLIRNLDAPITPQTFCLFLLEPDFVAKMKCYFSPSFVETICWCLDRQDKYKTYMEPLGRFPTGKILLHKTCSISARSFLKSLSI